MTKPIIRNIRARPLLVPFRRPPPPAARCRSPRGGGSCMSRRSPGVVVAVSPKRPQPIPQHSIMVCTVQVHASLDFWIEHRG